MKKSVLILSFAFVAMTAVTLTSCKNSQKTSEQSEATEKSVATEQMAVAEYYCPMKCEGDKTYTEMGSCPECGMDLVPAKEESETHKHDNSDEGHKH
jgi:Cu2+-exporting ATPase